MGEVWEERRRGRGGHDKINETRKRKLPIISSKKVKAAGSGASSFLSRALHARALSGPLEKKEREEFQYSPRRVSFKLSISSSLPSRLVGRPSYLKRASNQRLGYMYVRYLPITARRAGTFRMRLL